MCNIIVSALAVVSLALSVNAQTPIGVTPYECIAYTYTTRDQAVESNRPYSEKIVSFAETICGTNSATTSSLREFFTSPATDHYLYQEALHLIKLAYNNDNDELLVTSLQKMHEIEIAFATPITAPARTAAPQLTEWERCLASANTHFPSDPKRAAEYAKESYETILVHSNLVLLAEKQREENKAKAKAVANATRVVKTTWR